MSFTVIRVIDGDTIEVSPKWSLDNKSGSRVRLADMNAPEMNQQGGPEAKELLEMLILNEKVELKNARNFSYDRLVCDVYLGNNNIVDFL